MFASIHSQYAPNERRPCKIIIVTHVLPDKIAFLEALQRHIGIITIIPKPNSIHQPTYDLLQQNGFHFAHLTKEQLRAQKVEGPGLLSSYIQHDNFIILDIGGYFAQIASLMKARFQSQMIGIVEDTENGHQKYMTALGVKDRQHEQSAGVQSLPNFPLVSSARSPLKEPEDALIGLSIVFSAEAELRTRNHILLNKTALVLGYGKIGKSIAEALRRRDVDVHVCDINGERSLQAHSHGFKVVQNIHDLLPHVDMTFSATGNKALGIDEFERMKDEAYVVSATSADDEMHREHLRLHDYLRLPINGGATVKYTKGRKSLYLVADGEAANFLHCGSVGRYIHLVQGEIFGAALAVASTRKDGRPYFPNGFHEVGADQRQIVVNSWNQAFETS
jgi:adenosylhomocysteinase